MDGEFSEQNTKCVVCFEIHQKEIFKCQNGHPLCKLCADSNTVCPQCHLGKRNIRSRSFENLLDMKLDGLDCPYKSKGCKEKISRKNIASHSDNCDFGAERTPFCKYIGFECDHLVNSRKIDESIQHLRRNHPCILESASGISLELTDLKIDVGKEKNVWQPVILKAFDQNITFITQSDDKHVSFACILLGTEIKPKLRVEFCILSKLEKEPALKWTTEPIQLAQAKTMVQFPPFQFAFELLNQSYLENGELVVNILVLAKNSATKLKQLDVKVQRAINLPAKNSIYPNHEGMTNQSVLNETKFEDLRCDHCHGPFEHSYIYQCLECNNYKQCNPCMVIKKEHSFHHFAVIKSSEQHNFHQQKTIRGLARMPHVKCLHKVFNNESSRLAAAIKVAQKNLRCASTGCCETPSLICLFCRGPHSVGWNHINMIEPKHDKSHYFALAYTKEATKFALKILECDNLLQ